MRKERIEREVEFPVPVTVYEGVKTKPEGVRAWAKVYCPLCTRTVDARVTVETNNVYRKASLRVAAWQKCPRCSSSLDAAFVLGPNN